MAAWYGDQAALFTSITSGDSSDAPHRWASPDPRPQPSRVPLAADAQPPTNVPRIGFLSARVTPTPTTPDPNAEAFRQGLRDLGYLEGTNILVEYLYAAAQEGGRERFE
jgi:hypothetical protein